MKNYNFLAMLMALVFMLPGLSSCGLSSDSDSSDDEYEYYEDDEPQGYTISPTSEMKVRDILANKTFRANNGNKISFQGGYHMTVNFNGRPMANDIVVEDYGFNDYGEPYAVISVSGPYGHTTLILTELDTDYGQQNSRVVLFDVNDENTLYFRTR